MATISGTFFLSVFHLAFPEILRGVLDWDDCSGVFSESGLSAQKVAAEIHGCTYTSKQLSVLRRQSSDTVKSNVSSVGPLSERNHLTKGLRSKR